MGGVLIYMLAGIVIAAPATKPSQQALITRISKAPQLVSYKGNKISISYCGKNQSRALVQVQHLKPYYTRTMFLEPKSLAGKKFLTRNTTTWYYTPRSEGWTKLTGGNSASRDLTEAVLWNYDVKIVGEDSVANRKTFIVKASPKYTPDLHKQLWVDKENYIIVGQKIYTPEGRLMSYSYYTSISFNPRLDSSLFKDPTTVSPKPSPVSRFKVISPGYLPKGYSKVTEGTVMADGHSCYHQYFSNGVSGISFFQRPLLKGESRPKIKCSRAANLVSWDSKDMGFVLVGDVSLKELEKIAQSVKP